MVQLNCNLTHARKLGVEKSWVKLHDVLQAGAGTCFTCVSQPSTRFDTSFINALILTIIRTTDAALLILFTVVCES